MSGEIGRYTSEVEATRFDGTKEHADKIARWLGRTYTYDHLDYTPEGSVSNHLILHKTYTPDELLEVWTGEWVIKNKDGQPKIVHPMRFENTYKLLLNNLVTPNADQNGGSIMCNDGHILSFFDGTDPGYKLTQLLRDGAGHFYCEVCMTDLPRSMVKVVHRNPVGV